MKSICHYLSAASLKLRQTIAQRCDKRLNRKVIIFESDDWGAIRIPSTEVHDKLVSEGYELDSRPYEHLDGLERDNDVERLTDVLSSFTDSRDKHPIMTLNYLSANPDFDKIRESNFKNYFWEPIDITYQKYNSSLQVMDLVKNGIRKGIFEVQFHGREHFDIPKWLHALQVGNEDILTAFSHRICGIFPKDNPNLGNKYMVALKANDIFINKAFNEGITEFERIWKYKPQSFIAPCYTWSKQIEPLLLALGIKIIQTSRFQRIPNSDRRIVHHTGQTNTLGLIYTVRNCAFEPATTLTGLDVVAKTMSEIRKAFISETPAIVSTHRINYTSRLSENNAVRSCQLLLELLKTILLEFPDVEFSTGTELFNI